MSPSSAVVECAIPTEPDRGGGTDTIYLGMDQRSSVRARPPPPTAKGELTNGFGGDQGGLRGVSGGRNEREDSIEGGGGRG